MSATPASPTDRLREDLRQIVKRIREGMDRRRYVCISSLLYDLGLELWADHVGIIEDDPAEATPRVRRQISVCAPHDSFCPKQIPENELQRVLRPPRHVPHSAKEHTPALHERCAAYYFSEADIGRWGRNAPEGYWLVLVPLWPSHFWGANPRSRFWAYVGNPRKALPGPAGKPGVLIWELLRLCVEWLAWKHDRLSNRARLLEEEADNPERVVQAVLATMVRPFRPFHLEEALKKLRRPRAPESWTARGNELWDFAQRINLAGGPCNPASGNSPASRCNGCEVNGLCPQAEVNDLNQALTRLFLWKTGFWNDLQAQPSDEAKTLLDEAVNGLRFASASLDCHKGTSSPLNLKEGRDRLLLRFFTARAIPETLSRFEAHRDAGGIPLREAQLLACLAQLATLLLTGGDWSPDAIRNLIHVLAGYGHVVLGVPPWLDLARHLRQTLRGESALYTLKQRYRDHFFHTIEVCLIGYTLLISRPGAPSLPRLAEYILEACRKAAPNGPRFVPDNDAALLSQWWVAALLHDTAYGIDVLGGTLKLLDFFRNQDALSAFTKHVLVGVKELHGRLTKDFPELEKDPTLAGGDHGLIAASHLLETARRHGEACAERLRPAARAIAFHNTKYPRIDAGRDPVAALLVLCDTIQDWGRSQLGFDRSPTVVLSRLVSPAPTPEDEQFGPVQKFSFSMRPEVLSSGGPHEHVWERPNELDVTLEYGARATLHHGLFFTWADTTHNLRRVVFSPWGLRLRIIHKSPVPDAGPTKMAEFAQLVRRQEAGFLDSWVDSALSGVEGAPVRHESDGNHERLTFDLQMLAGPYQDGPLMGPSLGEFSAFLRACGSGDSLDENADPPHRPPV